LNTFTNNILIVANDEIMSMKPLKYTLVKRKSKTYAKFETKKDTGHYRPALF